MGELRSEMYSSYVVYTNNATLPVATVDYRCEDGKFSVSVRFVTI